MWLPNDLSLILGYYACLYLGLIAVPAFDENTAEEIKNIQAITEARYLLTTPKISQKLKTPTNIANQLYIMDATTIPTKKVGATSLTDPLWPEYTDAILFMTSGSTGIPKAVTYTHKTLNWANKIYQETLHISKEDRLVTTLDLYGNAGFALQILPLLNAGGTIYLLSKCTGATIYNAIEKGATMMCMIPYLGIDLLDYAKSRPLRSNQLKYVIVGGDRIPDIIFTDFPKLFNIYPNQGIGMSETNIYAINLLHQQDKPGSAGAIVPYTEVKIASNADVKQPTKTMGEILVKTPMQFDRYWNPPDITAQTFVNGSVKTGDLGYFDKDGYLYFAGRIKQIIINYGENIYPQEVEAACMEHPNIKSAIAVGIPNPKVGEEIAVALTLNNPNEHLTPTDLKKFLAEIIADFKTPTHI